MNFNKLANTINENLAVEEVEGRNPNSSFADWKTANPDLAKGPSAYYHFKKSTRGGTTPVADPVIQHTPTKIDPRKQEIVDQLVAQGLSPEEIYKNLKNTLPGEPSFDGNLKDVRAW